MASKYLNIKDNSKRQLNAKKEINYLSRKSCNIISSRINYSIQPMLFNKILLNILSKNNKIFLNTKKVNSLTNNKLSLPIIKFNTNITSKLKIYLNYYLNNLYKLEYNNNTLIRYFNIKKRLAKNSSFIRIKNRSVVSGRSHAIHRLFKLSRIKLRELGSHGKLMGLGKAS